MKFNKTIKLILKFTTYLRNLIMSQLRVCLLQPFKNILQFLPIKCWITTAGKVRNGGPFILYPYQLQMNIQLKIWQFVKINFNLKIAQN